MRSRLLFVTVALLFLFRSFAQENEPQPDTASTIMTAPLKPSAQSFSVITQKDYVERRSLPANEVDSLKQSDDYWYANLQPKKKETPKEAPQAGSKNLFAQGWLRNLLWLVVLFGFIAIVIWYLASSNVGLFRKEAKKMVEEDEEVLLDEDIFSLNYEREISKAVAAQNYRLAIRLWYLRTLKELADRNLITYRTDKTNNDYVNALYGRQNYREFFRLTRVFEYAWYGGFAVSEEAYAQTQREFQNFQNALRR